MMLPSSGGIEPASWLPSNCLRKLVIRLLYLALFFFQFYLHKMQVHANCNGRTYATHIDFNLGMLQAPSVGFQICDFPGETCSQTRMLNKAYMNTSDKTMGAVQGVQIKNR